MSRLRLSRFTLIAAAAVSAMPLARAGFMDAEIGVQTYRDLAENRGVYAAGATNVPIYNLAGDLLGTLSAPIPNFDAVVDRGSSTLTGNQFLMSVAHDGYLVPMTFTTRFGAAAGTVFYDEYNIVNRVNENSGGVDPVLNTWQWDSRVSRLSKVVTDAVSLNFLTDQNIGTHLENYTTMRIGAGEQHLVNYGPTRTASDSSTEFVAAPYTFLTAGTVEIAPGAVVRPATNDPTQPGSAFVSWLPRTFTAEDSSVLPIPVYPGDSGSALLVYNPVNERWEIAGVLSLGVRSTAENGGKFGENGAWFASPDFFTATINKYAAAEMNPVSGSTILWKAPSADADGDGVVDGIITDGTSSWGYKALSADFHGDTSTTTVNGDTVAYTTAPANWQNWDRMDQMLDLTFGSGGGNIIVESAVDIGAGSVTFKGDYTLSGARLITAGYIIAAGKTVTSTLTAIAGDEWRVIGDGKFVIAGSGANAADLNVGGNTLTELNRTGGAAVRNVKINGGAATVRLVGDNQISGDVIFGHRGGTLDLYGHDFTRAVIHALDDGATIANLKANSTATLTFTGSGVRNYLGNFIDGGSLATGLLNVNYNPGTPAGAQWNLSGIVANKGAFTVSAGEVRVAGVPTLHAGGYIDPNDWQTAVFDTGAVSVANGATFTAGAHARVFSDVTVAGGGTFKLALGGMAAERTYSGDVTFSGPTAKVIADTTTGDQLATGAFIGAGIIQKTGAGTLNLTGNNSAFTGTGDIVTGQVRTSTVNALGTGSTWTIGRAGSLAVNGATFASVKARIATGSTGTFALATATDTGHPDDAPNLSGYTNLFLGATGVIDVGTVGTAVTLTGWNATGGWNLGGGGGTLAMHLKLTGGGTLNVGNGYNTGTVHLTNIANDFTGGIVLRDGVTLTYSDIRALGGNGLTVNYGSSMVLGAGTNATTAFGLITTASAGVLKITGTDTNAYNFSAEGLHSAALGANGTATYSGAITPGTGGYKFGGNGALTVTTNLAGSNNLSADGQGTLGGVTTLTGNNNFSGAVTVQGGFANSIQGSHTLKLGSATSIGAGNAVTVNAGGILDLNGKTATLGTLSGTTGAAIINATATASTLTLNQAADATYAGTISGTGALNLVKSGAGTLTLTGANTYAGTTTVSAGILRVDGSLASAAVSVTSGATLAGAGTLAGAVSVGSGGTLALDHDATLTTGALTLNATSTLAVNLGATDANVLLRANGNMVLDGSVAITAASPLEEGVYRIADYTGTLTDNGATITSAPGGTNLFTLQTAVTGQINLIYSDPNIRHTWDGSNTVGDGNIAGGTGTWSTTGTNWANSSGTVNGTMGPAPGFAIFQGANGTVTINNTPGQVTATGMQFAVFGYTLTGGALTLINAASGNATIRVGDGTAAGASMTATIASVLQGDANLKKTDLGTLVLTGANTYTGTTTVANGALQLGSTGTLASTTVILGDGATSGKLILGNATGARDLTLNSLTVSGTGTTNAVVGGNATVSRLTLNTAGTVAYAGKLGGTGTNENALALVKSGTGTLALSGTNTYSGGTTLSAGTLAVNSAGALGSGSLTLAGGKLDNTTAAAITLATNNAQAWSGDFTFTGTRSLNLGTGAVTLGANRIVTVEANTLTVGGVISDGASTYTLTKAGAGTLTLGGTNSYNGGTFLNAGTLALNKAGALGTGTLTINGGKLDNTSAGDFTLTTNNAQAWNGDFTFIGTQSLNLGIGAVTLGGNRTITVEANTLTVGGVISGSFGIIKEGSGTLSFTNPATTNTYTGKTVINGGVLAIFSDASLGTAPTTAVSDQLTLNGGTLKVNSATTLSSKRGVTLGASGGTFDTAAQITNSTTTIAGIITGTGPLTLKSNGDMSDTGGGVVGQGIKLNNTANTFTGDITVSSGLVAYGSNGSFGNTANKIILNGGGLTDRTAGIALNRTIEVQGGGGTFRTASATNATWTGAITGTGNLRHTEGGTINLAGDLSGYSGTYDNRAGTTLLSGTSAVIGGNWIVTTGTLGVTGTATRTLGGTLAGAGALTKDNAGTLKLSGANTGFSGGTTITGGTLITANIAALGTGNVSVATNATLQVGDGTTNGVTLGSGATLVMDSGSILKLGAADSKITMAGSGTYTLTSGMKLDITGLGLGAGDYTLITGTASGGNVGTWTASNLIGGNAAYTYSLTKLGNNAVFSVTAVPEPATYGLIGAGALAAAALVRRRRRRLVGIS